MKEQTRRLRLERGDFGEVSKIDWPVIEPEDLNTDGFDLSGRNIWVHDCSILNDDDSVAIKPSHNGNKFTSCSENMLIENMVLTGFGASIGSVPPRSDVNCVRDITFRNISMPNTGKGIYIKSNPSCSRENASAKIENILFEDITITKPLWWAIWIGPQQQHQPGESLGELCALAYPIVDQCPTQGCVDFRNITLRNVKIDSPWLSPGVILGNSTNPIQGLVFDNVNVINPSHVPFGAKYKCENVGEGSSSVNSSPAPCF